MNIEEVVWWETRKRISDNNALWENLDNMFKLNIKTNVYDEIIEGVYIPVNADSLVNTDIENMIDRSYEY
jgi:hypothetical protein